MSDADNLIGRVLVVEDDEDIADVLRRSLRQEGHEVRTAADGEQALGMASGFVPDLVVLDLGLPKLDGVDVCRKLRAGGDVPILILTARSDTADRVEGLDAGADDYLVKPFERAELLARIRSLLRRRPPRGTASLTVGDLMLNPGTREVTRSGRVVELTNREFELLEFLMRNERLVISRERLLEEVWGYDPTSMTNTIDVFISNLRRKLEEEERNGSCTRSGVPATWSEREPMNPLQGLKHLYARSRRLPVRVRIAIVSATLTAVILIGFAAVVGRLVTDRLHNDFERELSGNATTLANAIGLDATDQPVSGSLNNITLANDAEIRIVSADGRIDRATSDKVPFGPPTPTGSSPRGPIRSLRLRSTRPSPRRSAPPRPRSTSSTHGRSPRSVRRSGGSGSSSAPGWRSGRCWPASPGWRSRGGRCARSRH
ncbi:MAG: response regulator transcription factor [Solirubrobacterales bacterium]